MKNQTCTKHHTLTWRSALCAAAMAIVAVLAGMLYVQPAQAAPKGTYQDGDPTYKVGMEIKTVDETNHNGVAKVSYAVTCDGKTIRLGPSDVSGKAKSGPEEIQLYFNAQFNKHILKMPLSLEVKSWPAEYEKPHFQIYDYSNDASPRVAYSNWMVWTELGHMQEAENAMRKAGIDPDDKYSEYWDGKVDGIYSITYDPSFDVGYPLFGERGAALDSCQYYGAKWQLPDSALDWWHETEDLQNGLYFSNISFMTGYDPDKLDRWDFAYGDIVFYTKTKPKYDVEVSKVALGGSEEIKGAELEITRTTNPEQEIFEPVRWTSGEKPKKIKLVAGDYVLTETKVPDGYKQAAPISFTVTGDGKVIINGKEQAGNKIVMEDEKKQPKLSIKKTSNVKKASPGDVIPFVITITNSGEGDVADVEILDTMGEDLSYVSDDAGGANDGQEITWTVDMPAGSQKEIRINCRINESAVGKVINGVEITNVEEAYIEPTGGDDEFEVVLEEYESPAKKTKGTRTGDTADTLLWIMLLASAGFATAAVYKRRSA